jgi:hypothetical protein
MKRKTPKDPDKTRNILQALQTSQNPRAKGGMVKTSIWLPSEMLDWLKEEASKRAIGMADEIRRRLLLSFSAEQEPRDERTELLLSLISQAAKILAADEPWYVTPFASETFQAAISNLISETAKPLAGDYEKRQTKLQDRYGADAKPETIGPVIAHAVSVDRATKILTEVAERAESYRKG